MNSKRAKSSGRNGLKKAKMSSIPHVQLNVSPILDDALTAKITQCCANGCEMREGDVEVVTVPFKVVTVDKFLQDATFIEELADELFDLELNAKNNDLYKFHQSGDMFSCDTPAILGITKAFRDTLRPWLKKVTGIELNDEISMSYSKYAYTDVLLCHDDELEGRRIAYIYYLVSPTWCEADGGALDLFNIDPKTGEPAHIEKSLLPKRNRFVFFEVTPASFHQVAEVITEDKIRHSLVGWFNGPPFERPPHYEEPPLSVAPHGFVDEKVLRAWINPLYLSEQLEAEVQRRFCDDSQTQLDFFLTEDRYQAVCEAFSEYNGWVETGPANRRKAFVMPEDAMPEVVREMMAVLSSEAMYLILSNMTGLPLHPLGKFDRDEEDDEEEADPKHRFKIRDWRHGAYTLVHDDMQDISRCVLDLSLFFNADQWRADCGGFTSYIADDEELLTVVPKSNSLSMVYREDGVLKFVKHVNHQMAQVADPSKRHFQDVHLNFVH
ncbi:2-oxoglutarate and iron-dependent oxygenase domain-containing protein 1-like [Tropilaelaps mercedesae]|uniref:2-oxoglutarate and iron-dependent oxygenase domain-containing protein 1-like n=1 Tax=Tropilaelaps mercedesae TaxID=418985 RepID=A0A1V9X152_9ACAR|nr:2-oxoglutarate and iron-dependent oxygenase domain-containing protein 1-like [Tropilaelaps mercedesae]